ncbi:hypothetical protein BH09BAC1_BH09BAC1_13240 [soil metagenome]
MYRAQEGNILLKSKDVALHFRDGDFDETRTDGLWLLGRQDEGYVAARRYCDSTINNVRACGIANGQSWVIVVGDSGLYGSFNNFASLVNQSQFSDEWYYDTLNEQSVYHASISFDTISIDYAWKVDSPISSVRDINAVGNGLKVYPNPTTNEVTIGLDTQGPSPANITVYNMVGQVVYHGHAVNATARIATTTWPEGLYVVQVEQNGQRYMQKLMKAN